MILSHLYHNEKLKRAIYNMSHLSLLMTYMAVNECGVFITSAFSGSYVIGGVCLSVCRSNFHTLNTYV